MKFLNKYPLAEIFIFDSFALYVSVDNFFKTVFDHINYNFL